MKSDMCRHIQCPFYYKFSGKAACQFQRPKKFIKHLDKCPQTI